MSQAAVSAATSARIALLPDRGVVAVTGEDAGRLLQGIITNDLDAGPAVFSALLSPQGKILFEFFVIRTDDGFLLDVACDKAADLAKRLTMYKLRAKAVIADRSASFKVYAVWGGAIAPIGDCLSFTDPRSEFMGQRWLTHTAIATMVNASAAAYHAHRATCGIPEGGKDWDFGDAFPHEANFDLDHGVSFDKGCYVGQEIVARMQHRATVKKRVVRVSATSELPTSRPDIKLGEISIGKLGSATGRHGLALLRLDRAIEAIDKGWSITADGTALEIDATAIDRHRAIMTEKAAHP